MKLNDLNEQTLKLLYDLKQTHPHTFRHSVNVSKYARFLGEKIGLDTEDIESLKVTGLLHDIGKLKIPRSILNKPGKLTDEEYREMKRHSEYSIELLTQAGFTNEELLKVIKSHHERLDGRGYPDGLTKGQIPFLSKIISIADSYDAMNQKRCYRDRQELDFIRNQFISGEGTQFDSRLTSVFLSFLDEEYIISQALEQKGKYVDILIGDER